MKKILLLTAALLGAMLAIPAPGHADEMIRLTPAEIGQIFCLSRLGNDMAPIEGLLSDALEAAIAEAEAKDAAWEAANPGDKPPLGDGIPWQTWPDYAAECTIGAATINSAGVAEVEIRYAFPESPDANFSDTLLLARVSDPETLLEVWRLDNVRYSDGNDLVAQLIRAFNEEGV